LPSGSASQMLAEVSANLGEAMSGVDVADNMPGGRMAGKGN
jgi:pyridoxal biosynthesis lyase PdxS